MILFTSLSSSCLHFSLLFSLLFLSSLLSPLHVFTSLSSSCLHFSLLFMSSLLSPLHVFTSLSSSLSSTSLNFPSLLPPLTLSPSHHLLSLSTLQAEETSLWMKASIIAANGLSETRYVRMHARTTPLSLFLSLSPFLSCNLFFFI
jgi:hypothetical protein